MSSMLPDTKPSAAKEVLHQGKGCAAVLLALAVLVVGGFLVYDQGKQLISGIGETPDYTGSGVAPITVTVPTGATLDQLGGVDLPALKASLYTRSLADFFRAGWPVLEASTPAAATCAASAACSAATKAAGVPWNSTRPS